MSDSWQDAADAVDSAGQATPQKSPGRLEEEAIAAASVQYADPISEGVQLFIDGVLERAPEHANPRSWAEATDLTDSPLGKLRIVPSGSPDVRLWKPRGDDEYRFARSDDKCFLESGDWVEWWMPIPDQDWPVWSYDGTHVRFGVRSNGNWYFGYTYPSGDVSPSYTVYKYGFDSNDEFMTSAIKPVRDGRVVALAKQRLVVMMRYYGITLPQ